jgi:hypothetical protein
MTAYFEGYFQNTGNRHYRQREIVKIPVQFQIRARADEQIQRVVGKIDHWNETLMPSDKVSIISDEPPRCKLGDTCKCHISYLGQAFLQAGKGCGFEIYQLALY